MADRFSKVYERPSISSYIPLPLENIENNYARQQKINDLADQERMDIAGKQWNFLPQDLEDTKKAKAEVNKTIDEFANKDFNDPSVRSEWYRKKRELADRFSPTGDIGNIQANYDAYNEYKKNILSKSKELGWSEDELRSHLEQAKKEFPGTVNKDGYYNQFQGKGVANYVDPNEWMSKTLKDVADDTGVIQLKKYGSLNEVTDAFKSGEINHKDYNKIINSIALRAQGDTKLKSSLEQEGQFRGQQGWSNFIEGRDKNGNIILNQKTPFGMALTGVGLGAQYQKEKEDYMKVEDPLKLHLLKKEYDKQDILHGLSSIEGENVENYTVNDKIKSYIDPNTGKLDLNLPETKKFGDKDLPAFVVPGEIRDKKEALKWITNTAEKLNIVKNPNESDNNYANRVLEEAKINQQKVIVNKPLLDVGESMDKLLIGKNGNKFTANYDDALIPGEKNPHPINEFIKDNNIDPATIEHSSVSFDKEHPGYILFTANTKDDDKTPIKFYAKSRNIDFKNSLEDATHFVKTFNKFYSTDEIPHSKREVNGQKFTVVGNINQDDNSREYYALDEEKNPVLVVENKETGEIQKFNAEQIKNASLSQWLNQPSTAPIIEHIKDIRNFKYE